MDVTTTSSLHLAVRQVTAIEAFTAALHDAEAAGSARGGSREARLDTARRLDVLRRQHAALVARAHTALQQPEAPGGARVLVAHRNARFRDRVALGLVDQGLTVLACLDNGADVVGAAVPEQPDLVLVEDPLPMMTTQQVVHEVRWSPGTFVAVQSADSRGAAALLDDGVRTVFGRQVPPADVACGLAAALLAPRELQPAG